MVTRRRSRSHGACPRLLLTKVLAALETDPEPLRWYRDGCPRRLTDRFRALFECCVRATAECTPDSARVAGVARYFAAGLRRCDAPSLFSESRGGRGGGPIARWRSLCAVGRAGGGLGTLRCYDDSRWSRVAQPFGRSGRGAGAWEILGREGREGVGRGGAVA